METLTDSVVNATIVLQRGKESLWLSNETGPAGHRYFVTLSRGGLTDYPVRYADGRIGYDRPEALTEGFRRMVRAEMNAERNALFV